MNWLAAARSGQAGRNDAHSAVPGRCGGTKGRRVVNSHASAPGRSVEEKDRAGDALSRVFDPGRTFTFLIGEAHTGRTCMN